MPPKKKSLVWRFYEKIDNKKSKCKLCHKEIKTNGNTTNLAVHIRSIHKTAYSEIDPFQRKVPKMEKISYSFPESTDIINEHETESSTHLPSTNNSQFDSYFDCDLEVYPIKRQLVTSHLESDSDTRKLYNSLLYMICTDNQPFTIVENEGFKHFMKTIAPRYEIPSRTSLKCWLDDTYEIISENFQTKLETIENLTITTDIWSDALNVKSFLGVTVHFGIDIELISVTLNAYELGKRPTPHYISELLLRTCKDWKIKNGAVTAVVTDNANNMVKAVDMAFGREKHIPCFAHTLNLIAEATNNCAEWQHIVTKINAIVTWFKQNIVAAEELREASSSESKLIQSVPTRWNSTYYMVQRFLEMLNIINDILFRHTKALPMLSASEISIASSVLLILRPLEAAIKEISGDKFCTTSKIIPLVRCMISNIAEVVVEEHAAKDVQKLVLQEMTKRLGSIEHVTPLAVATLLDPRFKKMHCNDAIACSNAISKIVELMEMEGKRENDGIESCSEKSEKDKDTFSLWTNHNKLVHRSWMSNKSQDILSDELSEYLRTPVARLNENPLEIWKDYKIHFPKLYKIAFKYLTVTGTSVPPERLFSHSAQVMTQQRNQLSGKRLGKLLFLQSIDKKYWNI